MNINDLINNPQKLEEAFKEALERENKKMANLLVDYITDPDLIYTYAVKIAHGKVNDKLEDIIAKDGFHSYVYAKWALNGPFPKGEEAIARNPEYSYKYAEEVLHRSFPKGEKAISQSPKWSYLYAVNVYREPFIEGEEAIISDDYYLKKYIEFLGSLRDDELKEFYQRHPELRNKYGDK